MKGNIVKEFKDFLTSNKDYISELESKDRNPLVFAFVGDAVFSLFVRTYLADISTAKAGVLHGEATKFVRASYQSMLLKALDSVLDETEKRVVLTARNTKTNNVAKHSNLEEYKQSTSFEALLGYLYLTHKNERLLELLEICKKYMGEQL